MDTEQIPWYSLIVPYVETCHTGFREFSVCVCVCVCVCVSECVRVYVRLRCVCVCACVCVQEL